MVIKILKTSMVIMIMVMMIVTVMWIMMIMMIMMILMITSHALIRGLDCQKRTRRGLCSKLADMRSVDDIALNPSLRKSNCE